MWSLMVDVCREMGVRTNVPFKDLTAHEKDIVYNGPAEKKHILYKAKNSNQAASLILPTSTQSTQWKTLSPKSKMKRA